MNRTDAVRGARTMEDFSLPGIYAGAWRRFRRRTTMS